MNLLDTHVLVWAISEPERLSPSARRIVEERDFVVSCASLWELITKKGRPTAPVSDPVAWWRKYVPMLAVTVLSISCDDLAVLDSSVRGPLRDPFDRILIAQAIADGYRLVTKDQTIRDHYQSHLNILW